MANEILLINPRKKRAKRKAATKKRRKTTVRSKRRVLRAAPKKRRRTVKAAPKKGVMTMARKKRVSRKRKSYKKNPSPRRYVKRAARSARQTFGSLSFKGALKNVPYIQIGMFGSKWLAKRFGGGASETDPTSWTWKNYLQGGLGAVAVGFLAQMVKPGSGQKVMEGGINLMIYEMIQNELISQNEWATGQFGEEEEDYGYMPGDVEQDESGREFLLGEDYQWRELPEAQMQGLGQLEPVGPLGQLEPVGPLGGFGSEDLYRKALLDT